MRTRTEFLESLCKDGVTVAGWARANGFKASQVRDVLRGKAKGRYGSAHEIAIRIGIKKGRATNPKVKQSVV